MRHTFTSFWDWTYPMVWLCCSWFTHASVGEQLGCFPLVIVNNAAINIGVQVSVQVPAFRSGIAGSYGNSIFNSLRDRKTVSHRGGTILLFCQPCIKIPLFPCSQQHLSFFCNSHFNGMKWYVIVICCILAEQGKQGTRRIPLLGKLTTDYILEDASFASLPVQRSI